MNDIVVVFWLLYCVVGGMYLAFLASFFHFFSSDAPTNSRPVLRLQSHSPTIKESWLVDSINAV